MKGNNETIKLQERKELYLQEILIQELTQDDVLFQIWKKGKFAQRHIVTKIAELTGKINHLEKYSPLVPYLYRKHIKGESGESKQLKQLKKERHLWENALLELDQQQIQKESKEES